MTPRFSVASAILGIALPIGGNAPVRAAPVTFTWNPAGASPALAPAGSAFTANGITAAHYFYAVVPTSGPFSETFIESIQSFTLGGAPVSTPGLNGTPGASGSYGLYIRLLANFEFVAGVPTFHSLDVSLIADPGSRDGAVSSTVSGVGFANTGATGAADDIILAAGSLVSASLSLNPATGTRTARLVDTFDVAAGETGFFTTPLGTYGLLEGFLTTPTSAFTTVPGPGGSTIQMVNGGTSTFDVQVPEPASLGLLYAALAGLIVARTRMVLGGQRADSAVGDNKRRMRRQAIMCSTLIRRLALGLTVAAGPGAIGAAAPIVFTLDPSKSIPALTGGPAAFAADTIQYLNFNRTTNFNDTTTLKQTVTADQYQTVTGFTLGGSPVLAPGLNSAYGLYFHLTSTFTFPINNLGTTIGPPTYNALNVSLVADVNDDDGALSTSASRIGFSNAAGVANDVTLATGSLISASLSNNPDGSRHNEFVTSFAPVTGEAGFFGPIGPVVLDQIGNTATAAFSVVPIDSQNFLTLVNGNLSLGAAQLVPIPEPASIAVLVTGLLGAGCARRRRSR